MAKACLPIVAVLLALFSASGCSARKNFILPAAEIVAMDTGINLANRQTAEAHFYRVSPESIRRNLRSAWVVDDDSFEINQFLHPYQGAMYHGIARSSGLNFWQSWAYTFGGSVLWEIAGEITPPSKNDQIASGIGGSFLGESLFRVSRLLLNARETEPGPWRLLGATAVSPPVGVNRLLTGHKYDPEWANEPVVSDARIQLGVRNGVKDRDGVRDKEAVVGLSIDYGLPGRANYAHKRPFDYMTIEAAANSKGLDSLTTRGSIVGNDFNKDSFAGVWGLFGTYDYLTSMPTRFSSTGVSFGTSAQFWAGKETALQTTVLAGVGYSAAQAAFSTAPNGYHYGLSGQGLVSARLIAGRRLALDMTARQYNVGDIGSFMPDFGDRIFRGEASASMRLFDRHAVSVKFMTADRKQTRPGEPQFTQTGNTFGVYYMLLGSGGFGAIR
jgi:hypothetical protein